MTPRVDWRAVYDELKEQRDDLEKRLRDETATTPDVERTTQPSGPYARMIHAAISLGPRLLERSGMAEG